MGLTPIQSHAESAAPLMVLPLLGDDYGPSLLMGLIPTQSIAEYVALLMGLTLF